MKLIAKNKLSSLIAPLLFIALYLCALPFRPLFAPDEIRYAEIPREMIVHGDMLAPRINNLFYFEKPATAYWPIVWSMKLFGENSFAVRLPSAIATLLTALILLLWGKRIKDWKFGKLCAGIYLTCGIVFCVGTFAVLDPCFTLFVISSLFFFSIATEREELSWKTLGWLALSGVCSGLGFLFKGALSLFLLGVAVAVYFICNREWKKLLIYPLPILLAFILTILPFVIAIHAATPLFWKRFLWVEHFNRAMTGVGASDKRAKPFWFYIPVFIGGFAPWVLFLPLIIRDAWKARRGGRKLPKTLLLPIVAVLVWLIGLSFSAAKLGTYILPCFAPMTIIFAYWIGECEKNDEKNILRVTRIIRAVASLFVIVMFVFFILHSCQRFRLITKPLPLYYGSNESIIGVIIGFVVAIMWFFTASAEKSVSRKISFCAIGTILFLFFGVNCLPDKAVRAKAPELFLNTCVKPHITSQTVIYAEKSMITAACWTFKREDILVFRRAGEVKYGLELVNGKVIKPSDLSVMIDKGTPLVVLSDSKSFKSVTPDPKIYYSASKMGAAVYNSFLDSTEIKVLKP